MKIKLKNNLKHYMEKAGMTYDDFEHEPRESRVSRATIWKIIKNKKVIRYSGRTLRRIHKALSKRIEVKFSELFPGQID